MAQSQEQSSDQNGRPIVGKENILLVDLHADDLASISEQLTDKGYKVQSASADGEAFEPSPSPSPDLIIIALHPPARSGLEMARHLSACDETRDLPTLFIGPPDDPGAKDEAFKAGGLDYLTRPVHEGELLTKVRTYLDLHGRSDTRGSRPPFPRSFAHEMRNPLNAILGFSQMMSTDRNLTPQQVENLGYINQCGKLMLKLINGGQDKAEVKPATETQASSQGQSGDSNLEGLGKLPTLLLRELRQFALELDLERIQDCIDQIESLNPSLGESLAKLTKSFQFGEISKSADHALQYKNEG